MNGNARAGGETASLTVAEGFLRVGSTNALNGVTVSFADGARLIVDPAATGDVASFGAVDLSAAPFGDMAYVSSNDADAETYLSAVSDISYDKVDAFSVCYAKDGKGNSDEVVVIRVKDAADTGAALASLQKHLQTRQSLYATYDPTQSQKVGNGITFSDGLYAVLIVSEDNAKVKQVFVDFMAK